MTIVDNRYVVERLLGEGGMGVVYLAKDTTLDLLVALKLLKANLNTEVELGRFVREVQLQARLTHPHIARVYNSGTSKTGNFLERLLARFELTEGKERHYIAMEYVNGQGLDVKLEHESLEFKTSIEFAIQTAQGLTHAHEQGIIHRDIKPSNLLIGEQGVKIVDFGIARSLQGGTLTQTGAIIGTPTYMSPEQARGEKADEKTDIYSLGVVLYQLLTGKLPYEGENALEILQKVINQEPTPPRQINPDIPSELEQITLKATSKNKQERHQTITELEAELQACLQYQTRGHAKPSTRSRHTTGLDNTLADEDGGEE